MSSPTRTGFALLSATLLMAAIAIAGAHATTATAATARAAATQTAREDSRHVSRSTVHASAARSAVGYWTRQRMANAQPYDRSPRAAAAITGTAPIAKAPTASATSVPPTAGALSAQSAVRAATGLARPYTNAPDRLNARLFFTHGGINYVCSGTLVNSASKRMVSTAGHCVSNGAGRWHDNMLVVPGYSSQCGSCGDAPYGVWSARTVTTQTQWHRSANIKHDVGFVVTRSRDGQRIVDALGGQGIRFNVARSQQFRAYGYPAAAPFSGFDQYACPSTRLADDNPTTQQGPSTIRIGCAMTGGASGGGWVIRQSGGLGFLNGINSYKYVAGPKENANHMYGPYFGTAARSLYRYTASLR